MTRTRLSRQELYDLVWAAPVRQIAPRYGVSDVGFAKACRAANIPLPPRGYWAKRQAGQHQRQATDRNGRGGICIRHRARPGGAKHGLVMRGNSVGYAG